MAKRPTDAKYTATHEWVRVKGNEATVGITDFAVEHLGDLVFVELPDVGRTVSAGEVAATVESVKAVGEVYSPVSGEVTAVNDGLTADQDSLAGDPFGDGWLFKVRVSGEPAKGKLMELAAYEKQLASEGSPS